MVAKMHRIHIPNVGEGVLHIPGGVPYEADDVAVCPDGTYARFGNKGFVYATASGSLIPDVGAKQGNNQKIGNVAVLVGYDAGDKVITINSDVSCDKDELVGGEVVVFPSGGNKAFTRGIIGNAAVTATASLELTLDSPIPCDIDTDASAEVILGPYGAVKQ